jgi:putative transcriptional regulator
MNKKLTGKALAEFEAERDVWQEVLDGAKEIKAGGGKRERVEPKSRDGDGRTAARASLRR